MFSISSGRGDFPSPTGKRMKVIINQGGGVFGYIITNFMSYLDFDLYGKVDVVAGTSVGGILALAYCFSQDYAGLNRLFRAASRRVFSDRRLLLFSSCRYGDRDLRAFLQELFGDRRLSDVRGVYALVTATDYTLKMPRVFDNISLTEEDDISLVDLGLYTSAAPTFFPARRHIWRGRKGRRAEREAPGGEGRQGRRRRAQKLRHNGRRDPREHPDHLDVHDAAL